MNFSYKKLANIAGWTVFAIATIVYFLSAERTGSLWDCGEFIAGAQKLQVVHPPGAALFLLVGRFFTMIAELFSSDPATIAFSVNMLSGICSAFAAAFVCWITIMLGKLAIVGRNEEPDSAQSIALAGSGLIAGLATAFSTSIWFSAVEGEVYAMSTFFTALTLWAMIKWYNLPDTPKSDRWLVFSIYAAGLSIGVHLLSILTFPALALFYYFKKYEKHTLQGMAGAAAIGVVAIVVLQKFIITGIPHLWAGFELLMVNGIGMPFQTGVIPTILLVGALLAIPLLYLHGKIKSHVPLYSAIGVLAVMMLYYITYGVGFDGQLGSIFINLFLLGATVAGGIYALDNHRYIAQLILVSAVLVVISFSTIGVVVIRANASTPINMNEPSDPMRLLPYLNREQYGERDLFNGPNFDLDRSKISDERIPRYGRVEGEDEYKIVEHKIDRSYNGKKMLIPRMQDGSQGRPGLYQRWMGRWGSSGSPSQMDNIRFMFKYQFGWMYWRYFMWNFSGRQNGDQGYYAWDPTDGNWATGIKPIDSRLTYNQNELPSRIANNKANNKYFLLPFLFGLLGMFFHFSKNKNDALGLFAFFIITGLGIIIYSNQPPNEPRERDYVLVGSFFTYCIWIGMGALALFEIFRDQVKLDGKMAAPLGVGLVLIAPLLMGFQNFDDHTRRHHSGARDYAQNFLQSVEKDAIIFTYGDNDTYPLWYAQEVENIRRDVRVVNLSLIAVDWYIKQLRRKVNDSDAIAMSIPLENYRGDQRNQLFVLPPNNDRTRIMPLSQGVQIIGDNKNSARTKGQFKSYIPSVRYSIPVNKAAAMSAVNPQDQDKIVDNIIFSLDDVERQKNEEISAKNRQLIQQGQEPRALIENTYLTKGDIATLDIISTNFQKRPIYFAVTCRSNSLLGLDDYFQLEGLGLKMVPVKTRDRNYAFNAGMMGKGTIDADRTLDLIENKFKWGGFDEKDLFVDRSFGPAIQSQKIMMIRTAETFLRRGENEKAIRVADIFFKAFPHKNFRPEFQALDMLDVYMSANAYDKAKPHIINVANETAEYLNFFNSIDNSLVTDRTYGFGRDEFLYRGVKREGQVVQPGAMHRLVDMVRQAGDTALEGELNTQFAPFQ